MLVSLNWLKKFVEIPKGFSAEEIAAKLTLSTVEVEGVNKSGELLNNVVVAKVLKIKPHPNADKLRLVTVDVGEKLEVVCGGTNLREGMLVALAKVGAHVRWHGEEKITELAPAVIRGVESRGMICAGEEIGLGKIFSCGEHEIADLSSYEVKPGAPIVEALKLDEAVLEVDNKSLSNRPDLWGHYGLARELGAILKTKLADYVVTKIKAGRSKKLSVEIKDVNKCQRYLGVVVGNVKIAPSPAWLAEQLEAVGVRSINNIVDVTNYVMLELGQPLHAFDWREVNGGKIIIEVAKKGEKFTTLDGVERVLDPEMLLIKDAKRAVALAGVMGGQNSEIKDDTKEILFEAANFRASNIRQTSTKLNLRTESSARFEKGLDPLLAETALRRAVELILQLIPEAKVASSVVDVNYHKEKSPEIDLDFVWLAKKLGTAMPNEEVADILVRLGFSVKNKKGGLKVVVPSYRATGDVSLPEDLVEEVARIYGYDNIPAATLVAPLTAPAENYLRQLERQAKNILVNNLVFSEVQNYSFVDKNKIADFGFSPNDKLFIALKNYLSVEQSLLRPSLVINLVKNVLDNLRFFDSFKLFELNRVFLNQPGDDVKSLGSDDKLPWQHKVLAGVMVEKNNSQPFYLAKGAVESLFSQLSFVVKFEPLENMPPYLEPTRTQKIVVSGEAIGQVGELRQSVAEAVGLKVAVGYFELDFEKLAMLTHQPVKYQILPKFPSILRDLALLIDEATAWAEIEKTVKQQGGAHLKNVELFDVYSGAKIEAGKCSLAFHLEFMAADKTLETAEVDKIMQKITTELEKKFQARVR